MKNKKLINNLFVSVIVSVSVAFVMIVICSIILLKTNISDTALNVLNLICFSIGAFAGGFTISKMFKEKGLVYGLINGLVLFLVSFITSLAINFSSPTLFSIIKLIVILISSLIGGITGVNTRKKRSI